MTIAGDESGLRVATVPIVRRSRRTLSSAGKCEKTGENLEIGLTLYRNDNWTRKSAVKFDRTKREGRNWN